MYIGAVRAEYAECNNCSTITDIASRDICKIERDMERLNEKLKKRDEEVEQVKTWAIKFKNEEKLAKEEAIEKTKVLESTVRSERRAKSEITEEKRILQRRIDAKQTHVEKLNSYQNVKNRQNNGDVKHYKTKCENFRYTLTQKDGSLNRLIGGINLYNNIPERSHSFNHSQIMQGGELDITLNSNVIVRERGQRGVDVSTDTNDLVSSSEQPTKLADFDDGETKNKVNLDDSLDTLRSESDTEAVVEQP